MLAFCVVLFFLVGIYLIDILISQHMERESDYVPILFALLLSCCFLIKSWYNSIYNQPTSDVKLAESFGKEEDTAVTSISTSVLASFYHDASMMRKRSYRQVLPL